MSTKQTVRAALICASILAGTATIRAAEFDAATVKPSQANGGGNGVNVTGNTLTMNNVTLAICLRFAYDLQDGQIVGPDSLSFDRFDIVAKATVPFSDPGQVKAMLQSLLTQRFAIVSHRENRERSVFALTLAKGGPKFQKSAGEGKSSLMGKQTVVAQWVPMQAFANFLSGPMRRPVIDETGLEGQYDFRFDLLSMLPPDLAPGQEPDVAAMVLAGLPEQLGLKLESRKVPVDVLVVDRWEKPGEN